MLLAVMALQTEPFHWASFTPLFVAVGLWIGFVGYGLFALRNHPRGLRPLFFTEMWERFSYYGMRALLMFYMLLPQSAGGIGLTLKVAGPIYGFYTFLVYALSVPGGWIADRFLGYRNSVIVGAVLIALGEFGIATGNPALFYAGLLTIAVGTGLLKTNCTSMVGMLYDGDRERQDAGYTIYYMGINIGALIAPLILGFIAQDPHFSQALHQVGLSSANGWHWAFGFAGVAMLAGLVQYLLQQKHLGDAGMRVNAPLPLTEDAKAEIHRKRSDLPAALKTFFHIAVVLTALELVLSVVAVPRLHIFGVLVILVPASLSAWILWQSLNLNRNALLLQSIRLLVTAGVLFLDHTMLPAASTGLRAGLALASMALAGLFFYAFLMIGRELGEKSDLTHEERQRMWVIALLSLFIMTFFFVFEQAGTTLNLFADEHTRNQVGSFAYPSAWYQSVNSIWLLILAPIVSWIWVSLGKKDPSSPVKFTLGLVFVGLGMLLLVHPSHAFEADSALKVSPNWLMGVYCLHTIGELCLSPVGLSTTSKLAPARYAGLMMGVFFFALGMGNLLAGFAAAVPLKSSTFFLIQFGITTVMAVVLVILTPRIKRMMGETN